MADRICIYCEDRGDCTRCSQFFEPDAIHSKCGRPWREHERHVQDFYPPWSTCPTGAGQQQ